MNSLGKVKNAHAARGRVRIFSGITQCLMSNGGCRGVMGWEDLKLTPSSETQGQLVGVVKSLNGPEKSAMRACS